MNDKTRDFIEKNLGDDIRQLALKGCRDKEVDFDIALRQIAGRQTARRKLPSWAALDGIIYPPHLNMEQCSSEQTARYKASICQRLLPKTSNLKSTTSNLLDLTGGFGVDFAFMSEAFNEATYVERNSELFAISSKNMILLVPKAKCINADGMEVLRTTDHVSMIFMDPARRDNQGARTYGISDCTPNVLEMKEELLQKADIVMLKLSPMLDWHKAICDLGEEYVKEVHIVSVQNECKELIEVLSAKYTPKLCSLATDGTQGVSSESGLKVICTNILTDNNYELFEFSPSAHHALPNTPHLVLNTSHFLYEPNASIMKAGCFEEIAQAFNVSQLAPNSHLFTSEILVDDFPGRKFQIQAISSMNKQELKEALKDIKKANISVRNFPMSVAELRKKLKISEGGNDYIFATTLAEGKKVLIICQHL